MATKNISITVEAYNRLARMKQLNESFSEIIIKITGKNNWRNYCGALSKESVYKLNLGVHEGRKEQSLLRTIRTKQVIKSLS